MVGGDWRLAVAVDWWLAVGAGWQRLVVGDWWLVAVGSGWRLVACHWGGGVPYRLVGYHVIPSALSCDLLYLPVGSYRESTVL